jgi:hypothetical protein
MQVSLAFASVQSGLAQESRYWFFFYFIGLYSQCSISKSESDPTLHGILKSISSVHSTNTNQMDQLSYASRNSKMITQQETFKTMKRNTVTLDSSSSYYSVLHLAILGFTFRSILREWQVGYGI